MGDALIFDVRGAAYWRARTYGRYFYQIILFGNIPLFVTGTKNILFHLTVL